jgi:alginate O-acetyltransferase complex protein AlgJ
MAEEAQNPPSRRHPFWDVLTIVVFLGLIWLPSVDYFFHIDHARPPTENRLLVRWPEFKGMGESREFLAGVESYFNDHFGFRKRLIRWNNHWKGQLFRDSTSKEVMIGRDGWLYFSGGSMLEHCTRELCWTERDLQEWKRLLETRRDWLSARGIKYLFVVPPDKHTVYPEHLPEWVRIGPKPTKVQQLVQYMKEHSTVEVLDLTSALVEAKSIHTNYLQTDTHWNIFGGFVGYRAVAEALSRQVPGLTPLSMDTYDWKPLATETGDLVRIMGGSTTHKENTAFERVQLKPVTKIKDLYDLERFPHTGTKETRPCMILNTNATGRAIVFHDSFACAWYTFLGQHFNETIYIWHYDWDYPLIEREKPDVVIDEMLERFFNLTDPSELARKDQHSADMLISAAK